MKPYVFAVCGVKNSGKTTLIEKLVHALSEKGFHIATIKHDAHQFDPDVPGRDSFRHRAAGAYGTAVFDADKFMIVKDGTQTIEGLLTVFPEADIILLEGARETSYPKIEIVRAGNSTAIASNPASLLALVTDLPLEVEGVPSFGLNAVNEIVEHMIGLYRRFSQSSGKTVVLGEEE